jgi:biotin-dependent carboxylase-like uncharacterized protein
MKGFIVKSGGLQSSIQDAGRVGVNDIGLTQSGAMDERSFGYANLLVGNPFNTPTIEIALGGLVLEVKGTLSLAITGADMAPTCNGKALSLWETHTLLEGDVLSFGFASSGHFAYLSVAGGLQTPLRYGSFSTSIKEGLGGIEGRKLAKDDSIETSGYVFGEKRRLQKRFIPDFPRSITLRVVKGYQEALFDESAQETFFKATYMYKGEGDRMGYRLSGEKVIPSCSGILSEAICYGAIQVPSHGEPIVLLKERQTIGGYPKIGSVIAVDCFKLAQLQAGGEVRFEAISLEKARAVAQAFYAWATF